MNANTATGIIHHLERGSCPNAPLNREKLWRIVRERDPHGVISKHLLEWEGSVERKLEATSQAYDPYNDTWDCCLCNRWFCTKQALDQHLSSPIHQQNLYHCPNSICRKEFTTLAAAVNHMESESCGYRRFNEVQHAMKNNISAMTSSRQIAF